MHPFALSQESQKEVTGGIVAGGCITVDYKETGEISSLLKELGGPIVVTLAIPEGGDDPRPFDLF